MIKISLKVTDKGLLIEQSPTVPNTYVSVSFIGCTIVSICTRIGVLLVLLIWIGSRTTDRIVLGLVVLLCIVAWLYH